MGGGKEVGVDGTRIGGTRTRSRFTCPHLAIDKIIISFAPAVRKNRKNFKLWATEDGAIVKYLPMC